jgi:anti-sigma regulatory factor (Ser/Thr protein kinase)
MRKPDRLRALIDMPAVADVGHAVQFYRREAELRDGVGTFLADGIRQGGVAIVIATQAHIREFDAVLREAAIDPEAARMDGRLVAVDAVPLLSRFAKGGRIDRAEFSRSVGGIVRRAAQTRRPVRAFGEMVSMLWDAGDVIGAIEVETLWNELRRELRFSLLCAYHRGDSLEDDSHADAMAAVCRLHEGVLGQFFSQADAPRKARRLVDDALAQWGHGHELSQAIALVVSELATNAVRHARSPFSVLARSDDQVIRISVRDHSAAMPQVHDVAPLQGSGMGLRMVAAIAGRWGVEVTAGGKSVWAQVAVKP